jgi:hypothetical protein
MIAIGATSMIAIVRLPCGCISDLDTLHVDKTFVACPWCWSAVRRSEFQSWMELEDHEIDVVSPVRVLLSAEDKLFEIIGVSAGMPIVRERDARSHIFPINELTNVRRLAN